jgi:hypothetical protein
MNENTPHTQLEMFDEIVSDKTILLGWTKITNVNTFKEYYANIDVAEYFNSLIYAQHSKIYFKIIDNILFFAKPVFNFNTYTITIYTNPISLDKNHELEESLLKDFASNGFSLRGSCYDGALQDKFGSEFIYYCDDFVAMLGSNYSNIRHRLKPYFNNIKEYTISYGDNEDIHKMIDFWCNLKKSSSQKLLYNTILKNQDKCLIATTYHNEKPIGFSVCESINHKNSIAIQRIINYESLHENEPNFILHYHDCLLNKGKLLNTGGSRTSEIKVAKEKLRPILLLDIRRVKSSIKLTREDYKLIKSM